MKLPLSEAHSGVNDREQLPTQRGGQMVSLNVVLPVTEKPPRGKVNSSARQIPRMEDLAKQFRVFFFPSLGVLQVPQLPPFWEGL